MFTRLPCKHKAGLEEGKKNRNAWYQVQREKPGRNHIRPYVSEHVPLSLERGEENSLSLFPHAMHTFISCSLGSPIHRHIIASIVFGHQGLETCSRSMLALTAILSHSSTCAAAVTTSPAGSSDRWPMLCFHNVGVHATFSQRARVRCSPKSLFISSGLPVISRDSLLVVTSSTLSRWS